MIKTFIAALIVSILSSSALAQEKAKLGVNIRPDEGVSYVQSEGRAVLGRDIYNACKKYFDHMFTTRENVARKATCNGYFYGVGGTILTLKAMDVDTQLCLPGDVSTEDMIRAFLTWAKSTPQRLDILATEAVIESVKSQYPCL